MRWDGDIPRSNCKENQAWSSQGTRYQIHNSLWIKAMLTWGLSPFQVWLHPRSHHQRSVRPRSTPCWWPRVGPAGQGKHLHLCPPDPWWSAEPAGDRRHHPSERKGAEVKTCPLTCSCAGGWWKRAVHLLVEDGGGDLHQHCGQVVSRLTVAHLPQQNLAAVVNHLPDEGQTGFPEKSKSLFFSAAFLWNISNNTLLTDFCRFMWTTQGKPLYHVKKRKKEKRSLVSRGFTWWKAAWFAERFVQKQGGVFSGRKEPFLGLLWVHCPPLLPYSHLSSSCRLLCSLDTSSLLKHTNVCSWESKKVCFRSGLFGLWWGSQFWEGASHVVIWCVWKLKELSRTPTDPMNPMPFRPIRLTLNDSSVLVQYLFLLLISTIKSRNKPGWDL